MKKKIVFRGQFLTIISAFTVLALSITGITPVYAASEAFLGGANKTGEMGTDIAIDDLSVDGDGNDEITLNLFVPEGELAMSTTTGLTGYSAGSNMTITGLRNNVNAALATLTYTNENIAELSLEVTIVSGEGEVFNPANGHVYQVVEADGGGITWDDAKTAAENMTYGSNNVPGYLVTIMDEAESNFVNDRLSDDGWIGASDAENDDEGEGDWKWVTGPEAGVLFWTGLANGSLADGAFANWNPGAQPDNSGNEDCGQIVIGDGDSVWNDLPCDHELPYYVVEFGGGIGGNPTVASKQITINVTGPAQEAGTCEELTSLDDSDNAQYSNITLTDDIDCEGQTIEPLFQDEPFAGTFNGDGHTISDFVIDQPESSRAGLIAQTGGEIAITNLNLEDIEVIGSYDVGGLIASGYGGFTITNVHARNIEIIATEEGYAGGLIGDIDAEDGYESSVENVSAEGTVSSGGEWSSNVGGLIGMVEAQAAEIVIEKVYANVDVINSGVIPEGEDRTFSDVGGLIGEVEADNDYDGGDTSSVTVQNAYAWGDVIAENSENVGGLIGRVDVEYYDDSDVGAEIQIESSYARGKVIGLREVGGLIGQFDEVYNTEDSHYALNTTFAIGQVIALGEEESVYQGGLVGNFENGAYDVTDAWSNYFDQSRTNQDTCNTAIVIDDCTAVNTDGSQPNYFINNTTNAPLNTWNFEDVWVTNETVPPTFGAFTDQDEDQDGTPTHDENSGPNNGDANNDGTLDSEQANVTSFLNILTGQYTVLETTCDNNFNVQNGGESAENKDSAYDYPAGLLGFVGRDCGEPGVTVTVKLYYYGTLDPASLALRKWANNGSYSTIHDASLSQVQIGGKPALLVTYQVTDGGLLDQDGIADGNIVDPVGLGALVVESPNTGIKDVKEFLFRR